MDVWKDGWIDVCPLQLMGKIKKKIMQECLLCVFTLFWRRQVNRLYIIKISLKLKHLKQKDFVQLLTIKLI